MSELDSSEPLNAVIATLRAAGCVFAEEEAQLLVSTASTPDQLAEMVDRRAAGLPLERVLGWAEFCGLRIVVEPDVFVPRRRTEFLVAEALALGGPIADAALAADPARLTPVVVDLCCGSGAVGAALLARLGRAELHASDIDAAAVRCARRNLGERARGVYEGDLFAPLPATLHGRVDLLLVNAPYVPTDALRLLPAEAREHEPRAALDGGRDGLAIQRRVAEEAALWLAPGGHVLIETSERQAPQVAEVVAGQGLATRVARSEEIDATVVIGSMPDTDGRPRP